MSYLRTFVILRKETNNGEGGARISGVGAVMPSGNVVLEWTNGTRGIAFFPSIETLMAEQEPNRAVIRWGIWDEDD